jgi:hypothetical protein
MKRKGEGKGEQSHGEGFHLPAWLPDGRRMPILYSSGGR